MHTHTGEMKFKLRLARLFDSVHLELVFRRAFPMGTVLEEPIELADLGAISGEDEADDFAVEAV